MARLSHLFDKLKAHYTYAGVIYTAPFKEFILPAAVLSASVGTLIFVPWMIAMAGKEVSLAFTRSGLETLAQRLERQETESILTIKEEEVLQGLNLIPITTGMLADSLIYVPIYLVRKLSHGVNKLFSHEKDPGHTFVDRDCQKHHHHGIVGTTKKIFGFCNKVKPVTQPQYKQCQSSFMAEENDVENPTVQNDSNLSVSLGESTNNTPERMRNNVRPYLSK